MITEIIKKYRENPCLETYSAALQEYHIDAPKCKCCGRDIYYKAIRLRGSREGNLVIEGTSYLTTKKVLGKDYSLLVCQECIQQKFSINNILRTYNVMSETTKFAFDIPDEVFQKARSNYGSSLEHKIRKFGKREGIKLWKAYCKQQSITNTFEYKQQKYGMTKEEFDAYNANRASTKENFIKRHGQEEGEKRWQQYCDRQALTKSKKYVIDHYGQEYADRLSMLKSHSLNSYITRYGKQKGMQRYNDFLAKVRVGYSEMSQIFFRRLDAILGKHYTTYFATKNQEFCVHKGGTAYFLDYFILELNTCIEFNGSCFHGDPNVYDDDDYCNPWKEMTAKQIREVDEQRYNFLNKERGIKTIVVWESECDVNNYNVKEFIKTKLNLNTEQL